MPEWQTCQRCGLKHTVRADGCPRCGHLDTVYAPPAGAVESSPPDSSLSGTEGLVRAIADAQRKLLFSLVVEWMGLIAAAFLFDGASGDSAMMMFVYPAVFSLLIHVGYRAFVLVEALGLAFAGLWCFGAALVGFPGTIVVAILSRKASRALTMAGCRVGLFGTNPARLTLSF